MEFSDLQQQFKGFTASQICTLAAYGRDILSIAGIHLLASNLVSLATVVLISDDIDASTYKDEIAFLLQIAKRTEDLSDECWHQRKTPLGLTGIDFDNSRFQMGTVSELSEVKRIENTDYDN
ncbi:hypothetical protein [Bacteroides sp. 51]|uniref:hypothetical protein n=1 Tax=Bacteroides sp. 51 TaxID=2302938 RepID=UPI0013D78D83|nr:hypothetical protein [Bacteroides sp. 51]NDV82222.1 hypothetical protein [Bacteroides sp. 51]